SQHAESVRGHGVELLDGPVVPCRVAGALERGVADREAEGERAVDDGGPEAVEVHVLDPQLRVARAVAVVLDAGPADGAEALRQRAVGRPSAPAQHAALTDPDRLVVAADDPRSAFALVLWKPRLPQVRRYRSQVEMVVTRVESRGLIHAPPLLLAI